MKQFKKVMFVVLALMPLIPIILFAVTNFNSTSGMEFVKIGTMRVHVTEGNVTVISQEGTIGNMIVSQIYGTNNLKGAMRTFALFADWLHQNIGMPVSLCLFALGYSLYLFTIELIMAIFSLITFVPRKCSEIFGG